MGGRRPQAKATQVHASLHHEDDDTPYVNPDVAAALAGEEVTFTTSIQE